MIYPKLEAPKQYICSSLSLSLYLLRLSLLSFSRLLTSGRTAQHGRVKGCSWREWVGDDEEYQWIDRSLLFFRALLWRQLELGAEWMRPNLLVKLVLYCKKWANTGLFYCLFSVFSNKHHYKFYHKLMWKNVHPVYCAGIQTHDLWNMRVLS